MATRSCSPDAWGTLPASSARVTDGPAAEIKKMAANTEAFPQNCLQILSINLLSVTASRPRRSSQDVLLIDGRDHSATGAL